MPAPAFTLTAKLQDIVGGIDTARKIVVTLCNFLPSDPVVAGTCILSEITKEVSPDNTGLVSQLFFGNDVIGPAGTFYCVQVYDSNDSVVWAQDFQFLGAAGDLSTMTPYIPPPPVPLGNRELNVVSVAGVAIFDAALGSSISLLFHIVLHENVNATFRNMIPGVPYQVIVEQDNTGGWTFDWPDNVGGPMVPVNPVATGITAQGFVGISDASQLEPGPSMMAIGPGVYLP